MKRLPFKEAVEQGYRAITSDIWPDREHEKHIITSIESNMKGCDAVWMVTPYESIQCGRKTGELILSESESNQLKGIKW